MALLLIAIVSIVFYVYMNRKYCVELNILQVHSYENEKMLEHIEDRKKSKDFFKEFILFLPLVFAFIFSSITYFEATTLIILIIFILRVKSGITKKPLVNTDRVKRMKRTLMVLTIALICISAFPFASVSLNRLVTFNLTEMLYAGRNYIVMYVCTFQTIALFILSKMSKYLVVFSNILMSPIEKKINQGFYDEASEKLKSMKNLKIVGITGSYGKTSTKYILDSILSAKFNVCKTPESYNTLMGVIKTIRNDLKPMDDIFIVEMGARKKNDIKEICDLVKPEYGIITAIGNQHLESFKSIDNIKSTKYELVRSLEGEKLAFLNIDNEHIKDIVTNEHLNEMQHTSICYSLKNKEADYYVSDIEYTKFGSNFMVTSGEEKVKMSIKLLGLHNIYNSLGAIAIAHRLGMSLDEISAAIKRVKPVPHRLEIIKNGNSNLVVIDDTFNANTEGTKEALEVLKRIEGKKKIIITPGMIELGEKQYQMNMEFGEKCARTCDYTIMVGVIQTKPMQDAFKNMGIEKSKYYVAKNLDDATAKLQEVIGIGDVVLYENDLPEDY